MRSLISLLVALTVTVGLHAQATPYADIQLNQHDQNGSLQPTKVVTGSAANGQILQVQSDGSVKSVASSNVAAAATTTTLGGVIVPTAGRIAVDGSGNISLPVATASLLGGVIVPATSNLTVDGSGNIATAGTITTFNTNGSGSGITVNYSGRLGRAITKVTMTFTAFSAAAKTKDLTILTVPAKTRVVGIIADVTATFTGGGETVATLKTGKTAGGAEYLAVGDVFTAPITLGLLDADMGTSLTRAAAIQGGDLPSWGIATAVNARLTTTTNNTSTLTTGSVTFYVITESM